MAEKLFLTNPEVSRRYGIPYETVLAMSKVKKGGPPGITHGNRFLWLASEAEGWLRSASESRLSVAGAGR